MRPLVHHLAHIIVAIEQKQALIGKIRDIRSTPLAIKPDQKAQGLTATLGGYAFSCFWLDRLPRGFVPEKAAGKSISVLSS